MTKAFLAIKGVSKTQESVFARHNAFKTHYEVGKRIQCLHPQFPFWFANKDMIWPLGGGMSIGSHYDKIMVVRILVKDLAYCSWVTDVGYGSGSSSQSVIFRQGVSESGAIGASSVMPLQLFDKGVNLHKILQKACKHYHLPPAPDWRTLEKWIKANKAA